MVSIAFARTYDQTPDTTINMINVIYKPDILTGMHYTWNMRKMMTVKQKSYNLLENVL